MSLKPFLAASLIGLATLATPNLSFAQEATAITAETVTDEQVSGFVQGVIAMEQLRKDYTVKIAEAATDDERAKLAEEADTVAKQLIEAVQGISPDEYLVISKLSREDAGLYERVQAEVQRLRDRQAKSKSENPDTRLQFQPQTPSEATE